MSIAPPRFPRTDFVAMLLVTDRPWRATRHIEACGNTPEDAHKKCMLEAQKQGWNPPARWQWWRKGDWDAPKTVATPPGQEHRKQVISLG